ncbi:MULTISPECIES: LysR family transcriptional regulator [Cytobacillus]|uniref:LysR family transcriptional regulator n=1 Tax=Cytobacillus stercorigallinarum TaxID=2762240 RepID=A0ABR8QS60_9BACI|nr:LysR family transcriptional regulator [Cytobacillus stercorigallinarum]MBD7938381.1 LysR family transcriptional regulator [Cytobacillus stercorigallinarum]
MDIRQLQYYKTIVEQGSISKAAKVLHMAQPPLSQVLKKLETDLGSTLIHRYREKWELTETGNILYKYATQMLMEMHVVEEQIQEIERGDAGTVRIGVSSSCSNLLLDYISLYREEFPYVKISILNGNTEELLKRLDQREIDMAFLLRPTNNEQYEIKSLNKQSCVAIIPSEWADQLSPNSTTFEEIASFPFILLGALEGLTFTENILKSFEERNLTPNIIIECKDVMMAIQLVSKGLGISIIPQMDNSPQLFENIEVRAIQSYEYQMEPVFLRLKEKQMSKASWHFWKMIGGKS